MKTLKPIAILAMAFLLFSCKKVTQEETPSSAVSGSVNTDGSEEEDKGQEYEPTFRDKLFCFGQNEEASIAQTLDNGNTRRLIPYINNLPYKTYILYDENPNGGIDHFAYVLSKEEVPSSVDMTNWNLALAQAYHYEEGQLSNPASKRLTAHYKDDRYELNTLYKNANIPPVEDAPVCIDWYWTTWDDNDNVIDEVFLFSTCMGSGGGGTGGTGGSNPPSNQFDTIELNMTANPIWWVVPPKKDGWFTLSATEKLKGIKYVVMGNPTPTNPLPTAPKPIFTFAEHGSEFFITALPNYTWVTSVHYADIINPRRVDCRVEGKITYPGVAGEPHANSHSYSPEEVGWK